MSTLPIPMPCLWSIHSTVLNRNLAVIKRYVGEPAPQARTTGPRFLCLLTTGPLLRPIWLAYEKSGPFNEKIMGSMPSFKYNVTGNKPSFLGRLFRKFFFLLLKISNQLLATLPFVAPDFELFVTRLVRYRQCKI